MFKTALSIACLVAVTGCASIAPYSADTIPRMSYDDLNSFRLDCNIKEQQYMILQAQLTTSGDRILAIFGAVAGDETSQKIVDRSYDAAAQQLMYQLGSYCPNKTKYDYEAEAARANNGTRDLNSGQSRR
jgi:hypothetical protein